MILLLAVCASAVLLEADAAVEQGDYDTGIDTYRHCLEADPESYAARYGLARALSFSGQLEEAIEVYTDLLTQFPNDADVRLGRGRVFAWSGRYRESLVDLEQVVELYPGYADAWRALGDVHLWAGHPREAYAAYSVLISLEREVPSNYVARARAERVLRRFAQARQDLLEALALTPEGADVSETAAFLRDMDRLVLDQGWELALGYDQRIMTDERSDWRTARLAVRHDWEVVSVTGEAFGVRRYEQFEASVGADTYLDLWPRAYGNLRFQVAPGAEVLPVVDVGLLVFQGFADVWELSAGYRVMGFAEDAVHIPGVGLAVSVERWYVREYTSLTPNAGELGYAFSFTGRYYVDTVDDLVELNAATGTEVVPLPAGRAETRGHHLLRARGQTFIGPRYGVNANVSLELEEDRSPSVGLGVGLLVRFATR